MNMCQIISSEAVIGNLILESVERNLFSIPIDKIINYDELLSQNLEENEYYTRFDFDEILDFIDNFPFFVYPIESEFLSIHKVANNTTLINQLTRYFRIGMPTPLIKVMKSVSRSILE